MALKSKEFDTIGEICFAVVTSEELSIELGVDTLPNARLMLWNDTKVIKVFLRVVNTFILIFKRKGRIEYTLLHKTENIT